MNKLEQKLAFKGCVDDFKDMEMELLYNGRKPCGYKFFRNRKTITIIFDDGLKQDYGHGVYRKFFLLYGFPYFKRIV